MPRESEPLPAVHEAWLPREHALHRPRHGGRQLTALVAAVVFFLVPTMLWVFGGRPSEIENHKLAGVGTGWGLFTSLPAWSSDHLVFRATAIDAAGAISGLFGQQAPVGRGNGNNTGPLPGSGPESGNGGDEDLSPDQPQGRAGYQRVVLGTDGWMYFGGDAEAKCSPARSFSETAGQLNKLREAVQDSGREFVFVVAPDKTTMVPEHLPADYPNRECSRAVAQKVWHTATEQAGAVDLRGELSAAARRAGHPLYYTKGTHWKHRPAIILTRRLAETLRPGISQTWQTEPDGSFTSSADLPPMLGKKGKRHGKTYELRPNGRIDRTVDGITSIKKPARHKAGPLESTVNAPTLVLGDSFTLASTRYLPAGFSDLTMLTYGSAGSEGDPVLNEMVDSDVVVLEMVERGFASGTAPVLRDDFIQRARQTLHANPR